MPCIHFLMVVWDVIICASLDFVPVSAVLTDAIAVLALFIPEPAALVAFTVADSAILASFTAALNLDADSLALLILPGSADTLVFIDSLCGELMQTPRLLPAQPD